MNHCITILTQIMPDCSFSRSVTTYCLVAMILLFGSVLEVIEKLRPFARKLINCVSDITKDAKDIQ